LTQKALVAEITGVTDLVPREVHERDLGPIMLEADRLTSEEIAGISLSVRAGEIVGLAGLVGAGRTETCSAIIGLSRVVSGTIKVNGHLTRIRSPRDAIALGVAMMPEERRRLGMVANMSVRENITLSSVSSYASPGRWGLVSKGRERSAVTKYVKELRLKTASPEASITSLSGGNQQKVILARLLESKPRVLLLDEPTKGVDVGAKQEMFRLIQLLASQGTAIVFVSSDLDEVCDLCDRAIVLRERRLVGELDGAKLNKKNILKLCYQEGPE
jgi:ABC-type sugar transport system ATPase subunit